VLLAAVLSASFRRDGDRKALLRTSENSIHPKFAEFLYDVVRGPARWSDLTSVTVFDLHVRGTSWCGAPADQVEEVPARAPRGIVPKDASGRFYAIWTGAKAKAAPVIADQPRRDQGTV
jgi:hypothetical protein